MGFRFRKRISLGGLAHINLSATGASLSVGPRGANINLGGIGPNRHPRATVGIPGTGLYYQQRIRPPMRAGDRLLIVFTAVMVIAAAIAALTILTAPARAETRCSTVCSYNVCRTVCKEVYTQSEYQRDNLNNEIRRLNREDRRCYDTAGC